MEYYMSYFKKIQIQGTQDDGTAVDIPSSQEGHAEVEIHGPLNPFGSVHTEGLTPIFQTDAVYGINPQQITATTVGQINTREDQ
jgi:hypothetical protein